MNLFKAEGVKDYAAAASQIPVIDFGPYFAGEAGAFDRLVPQVRHACETVGFFYAADHGVTRGDRPGLRRGAPFPRAADR